MTDECSGPGIAQLRSALTSVYRDVLSLQRVLDDIGIDWSQLHQGTSLQNMWHQAVREACQQHKLLDLVAVAQGEYPDNKHISHAAEIISERTPIGIDPISTTALGPHMIGNPVVLSRNFIGRERELADLLLFDERHKQTIKPNIIVIHGLSGVGKTQLARRFLNETEGQFQTIIWEPAASESQLVRGLAQAAVFLGIPDIQNLTDGEAAHRTRLWLESHPDVLLILDSADLITVRDWLPQRGTCTVLVTSTSPDWHGISDLEVRLLPLPTTDAAQFLAARTGKAIDTATGAIAIELGNLPIALEQAGAYIEQTDIAYANYADLLRTSIQELMDAPSPSASYPTSFLAALRLSIAKAEAYSSGATELLALMAHLGSGPIARDYLRRAAEELWGNLEKPLTDLEFNKLIASCRAYSLIDTSDGYISMHPLVSNCIRSELSAEQRRVRSLLALLALSRLLPDDRDSSADWWLYNELSDHLITLFINIDINDLLHELLYDSLRRLIVYLSNVGRYDDASRLAMIELQFATSAFGEYSCEYAAALNSLASGRNPNSESELKKDYLIQSIRILESLEHRDDFCDHILGVVYSNYARRFFHDGGWPTAIDYLRKAYAIHSRIDGPDSVAASIDLNNLAMVYRDTGNYDLALTSFEEVVRNHRKNLGESDYRLSVALLNLATVESVLGNRFRAEQLLAEANKIDDAIYGEVYLHDRITAITGRAALLFQQEKYSQVVKLYDRGIMVVEARNTANDEFLDKLRSERNSAYREMMRQAWKMVSPITIYTTTKERALEIDAMQRVLVDNGLPTSLIKNGRLWT